MTNAVKPRVPPGSIRMAGVAAIFAGGWCCWLALAPRPDVAEPEAFHDWNESQPIAAANDAPRPPHRMIAEITEVTPVAAAAEDTAAVIFAEFEQHPDEAPSIEPVGHAEKAAAPVVPARKSNGVWLTGTIEDDEPSTEHRAKQPQGPLKK